MRRIVLIDGENLVCGLRHLLGKNGNKAPRSTIENFKYNPLLCGSVEKGPKQVVIRLKGITFTEDTLSLRA